MSFSGQTPESLLPRSDSKNPATTCKGITTGGRACRRSLASSNSSSPLPSRKNSGVLAVLDDKIEENTAAAAAAAVFYCWQHKDQAQRLISVKDNGGKIWPLRQKSSIDTLIEKVGILQLDDSEVDDGRGNGRTKKRRRELPDGWNGSKGPLTSVPEEHVVKNEKYSHDRRRGRSNVKVSWACCLQADESDDDNDHKSSKPTRRRIDDTRTATRPRPKPRPIQNSISMNPQMATTTTIHRKPIPLPSSLQPRSSSSNHTPALLSFIPLHLPPQTTSLLLAELSRPISPADESGYIYIFWLTPPSPASSNHRKTQTINVNDDDDDDDDDVPDEDAASSLLDDDHGTPSSKTIDKDALLNRYASVRQPNTSPMDINNNKSGPDRRRQSGNEEKTITLKIGRASNVHRRLSQWSRQCGLNITLIRYYPYPYSGPADRPKDTAAAAQSKIPHIHRVERLIHLELSSYRVHDRKPCDTCGREHREWFTVPATRGGLRAVDEVVRRWVRWGFGNGL